MIEAHLDPSIPLIDVPEATKARLIKNEARQRYATNKLNKDRVAAGHEPLPVEKVDIIAIAEGNDWACGCHKVFGHTGCWSRVDVTKSGAEFGAPIIGHIVARSLEGGHTKGNVDLFRSECNTKVNRRIETTRAAKYKRTRRSQTGANDDGTEYTPKQKKAIPSHSKGLQSRSGWGSRKMRGANQFNNKPKPNVRYDD